MVCRLSDEESVRFATYLAALGEEQTAAGVYAESI
jgi:hypothetical protein